MPTIKINEQTFNYTLHTDRRRKTVQLRILPAGVVEIISPTALTQTELKHIFTAKSKWLKNRLDKLSALAANPVNQQLKDGCQLLYKGKPYTLRVLPGSKVDAALTDEEFLVTLPQSYMANPHLASSLEQIIKAWLIRQAGELFYEKTQRWAQAIGVRPAKITIKDQKTRWGSCSSLGNINYNWRIIMAPPLVADYLVIHELCHMLVPNHSAKFWEEVRRYSPNYQQHRQWLTDNGKLLSRLF